jgi:hypothetical protein
MVICIAMCPKQLLSNFILELGMMKQVGVNIFLVFHVELERSFVFVRRDCKAVVLEGSNKFIRFIQKDVQGLLI